MSELEDALSAPAPTPAQSLEKIRASARQLRDARLELKEAEVRVESLKAFINGLEMTILPDLFDQFQVNKIGLDPEGNMPGYDITLHPYYKAVLPKEADAGLRWLEDNGAGDLIKRTFEISMERGSEKQARALRCFCEKQDLDWEEKESVHWATLTSWVKEQIEKKGAFLPLDILGAIVGRTVKLKQQKEN